MLLDFAVERVRALIAAVFFEFDPGGRIAAVLDRDVARDARHAALAARRALQNDLDPNRCFFRHRWTFP